MRTHVLDASALYRYFTQGDGSQIVADVLKQATAASTRVVMSVINWGEVYYALVKRIGMSKTGTLISGFLATVPISLIGVTAEDAVRAARLKAQSNIPYADAFAAALTGSQHVLVTADVEHFEGVPKLRLLKLPRAKKK